MPFNERNSSLVWIESIHWVSSDSSITETAKNIRTLSLHVLSDAGFDKFYSFNSSTEPPKIGHMFNYRDSLSLILENILLIFFFGSNIFLPRAIYLAAGLA